MRIRRKKHLDERLFGVKELLIVPDMDIKNVKLAIEDKKYFDFKDFFNNDNPVELEVGCGKGGFIVQKAKTNKDVNFLAVELLENIIVMACELAQKENLTNVKFINSGAEYLPRYIREKSISNIYLNFSPPFPKSTYESRRLTSDFYVQAYKTFLKDNGCICQKTDDKEFFDYSFSQFEKFGFEVQNVTEKLRLNEIENVETEYEKMFKNKGMLAYALIAKKA
ncbi:MAG: tRNA (guanosine(46)-N7)-methyltransferase TrmB [Clostridiales bacterium]|nr:tRNA (guanosine(46)-N7)-methyltransferase TrmB [Clostridiales bacterium]